MIPKIPAKHGGAGIGKLKTPHIAPKIPPTKND
jgi:hypothetical protein